MPLLPLKLFKFTVAWKPESFPSFTSNFDAATVLNTPEPLMFSVPLTGAVKVVFLLFVEARYTGRGGTKRPSSRRRRCTCRFL